MQACEKFNALFQLAKNNYTSEIEDLFNQFGNEKDKEFIEKIAYFNQIVVKKSLPNFNHGFLLYYSLSRYLNSIVDNKSIYLLDIGTARGFSSLVMSYVLRQKDMDSTIISMDVIGHDRKVKWNCVLDGSSGISRRELVERYDESQGIIFLKGKSKKILSNLGLPRVHFAFVDGDHRWRSLKSEVKYLSDNQKSSDMILFDDFSPNKYPDVVKAVNHLEKDYKIEIYGDTSVRGYALLTRI